MHHHAAKIRHDPLAEREPIHAERRGIVVQLHDDAFPFLPLFIAVFNTAIDDGELTGIDHKTDSGAVLIGQAVDINAIHFNLRRDAFARGGVGGSEFH